MVMRITSRPTDGLPTDTWRGMAWYGPASVSVQYLDGEPSELAFAQGSFGKPYLLGHEWLKFNLSHSHDLSLIAVSHDRRVGVDVELVRKDFDLQEIAHYVLTRREQDCLYNAPTQLQLTLFYAY